MTAGRPARNVVGRVAGIVAPVAGVPPATGDGSGRA